MLLWVQDVKSLLGISQSTLDRMIASGAMPPPDTKVRGRRAWKAKTIEKWVDAGCPEVIL